MVKKNPYKELLRAIFYGRPERRPNLGGWMLITKYKELGIRRFAIWHKKEKRWIDKDGIEYKDEELTI